MPRHDVQSGAVEGGLTGRVIKQERSRTEQQASEDNVPQHHDPMEASLVNYIFAGDQVRFYVAHLLIPPESLPVV